MAVQGRRYLHSARRLPLEAGGKRAEAALREKTVVWRHPETQVAAGVLDPAEQRLVVDRHAAEDEVGVPADVLRQRLHGRHVRSEEHTSELQSLMRISYAVFCLKKKNIHRIQQKRR